MNLLSYVHLRNIHRSTGAGRVARQLTENLAVIPGVDIQILADLADHRKIVKHVGAPWTNFRYRFFRHETSTQQARWFLLGGPRAETYWPEVDLIHCTMESYVPTKRARLVVTVHDAAIFEQNAHAASGALTRQRIKWKLLYGTLSRHADMLHTVSNFSADRLAHFFPSLRSRLRVVHNAVATRFFQPPSTEGESVIDTLGLRDRPFILLPGGLHYRKNAELVLQAWPLLHQKRPDVRLLITNHCNPAYEKQARELGSSVMLAGFVEDEALCSLYSRARVVWFPSRYEGFGLPILEAMACGTPSVASDISSIPEVSGDAAVLAPPDDPKSHVEALLSLLDESSFRSDLQARGRMRASRFTWAASAAHLHKEFMALV